MIAVRGQVRRNMSNTREILGDLFGAKGVGEVADKAAQRKPRMHLLPYGIPLCLGFISLPGLPARRLSLLRPEAASARAEPANWSGAGSARRAGSSATGVGGTKSPSSPARFASRAQSYNR